MDAPIDNPSSLTPNITPIVVEPLVDVKPTISSQVLYNFGETKFKVPQPLVENSFYDAKVEVVSAV